MLEPKRGNMVVAVFSYNRGRFLKNCIESILDNLQFEYDLVVYDDNSDDPFTNQVLEDYSDRCLVQRTGSGGFEHKKVNGLFSNMNAALDLAIDRGAGVMFAIQDDMQVIRRVDKSEADLIGECILGKDGHTSLVPTFFKMNHKKNYGELLDLGCGNKVYKPRSKDQVYMTGVAATGLMNVEMLKEKGWRFASSEDANMDNGRSIGFTRAVYRDPFVAYLPWPKTIRRNRGKVKLLYDWGLNKYYKTGFYPYKYMSEEAVGRMRSRSILDIPFAEEFLTIRDDVELRKPWNYYHPAFAFRSALNKWKLG